MSEFQPLNDEAGKIWDANADFRELPPVLVVRMRPSSV